MTAASTAVDKRRAEVVERDLFLADVFDGIYLSDRVRTRNKAHFNSHFKFIAGAKIFCGDTGLILLERGAF